MSYRRHLGCSDAGTAVQCWEDLAERDHLAADAGFAFDQRHLKALVGQIKSGLHSRDSPAHHKGIYI